MKTADLIQKRIYDTETGDLLADLAEETADITILPEPVDAAALVSLYETYRNSVPLSSADEKISFNYFKATDPAKLAETDINAGIDRRQAKETLELTLLSSIIHGTIKYPDTALWFWQPDPSSGFVILRDWL